MTFHKVFNNSYIHVKQGFTNLYVKEVCEINVKSMGIICEGMTDAKEKR